MKKTIFALTTALALASPSLTLEAIAGNPFVEAQQRTNQSQTKQAYNSQPQTQYKPVKNPFIAAQEKTVQKTQAQYSEPVKTQEKQVVYKTENPVQDNLVDLTKKTSDRYIKYANLEQRAEQIPVPMPEPPVPQEYPATQYATQPQYATVQPEVCKPVQKIPMLVQGPPVVHAVPQIVYAPTLVVPSPTTIIQPVVPVMPVQPGYIVYRDCIARPFGGLFFGIGKALKWLTVGPNRPRVYVPGSPGYIGVQPINMRMGMVVPPMIGVPQIRPGIGMPYAPRPFMQGMPHTPYPYRPFW